MSRIRDIILRRKWKVINIAVIAILVILVVSLSASLRKEKEEAKKTPVDTIREELVAISEYAAYEYNYTAVLPFFEDTKMPFDATGYLATIDGDMVIGIKADKVQLSEQKDVEGVVRKVKITVPKSDILRKEMHSETLKEYVYDKNLFNPITPEELNQVRIDVENEQVEKVRNSDILKKCDIRIKNILKKHVQSVYGNKVKIEIEYLK